MFINRIKRYFLIILVGSWLFSLILQPVLVLASPASSALDKTKTAFAPVFDSDTTNNKTIGEVIGDILSYVLSFLGTIFLILLIYAGFLYMTAGGESDKVTTAKSILINATIGLIIVISSYTITFFVVKNLTQATATYF